ncbi:Bug family tripartite tricarboxylate transporter substrate binding protein [Polaromonas sp. UC242_47]|uniref:Bug family tripartite tricarboxylate transporter substrate binding protein n=1 Tax=Polaromonas sp. UC242_47 TaxID=3374626 RepID=UPI0037BA8559
MKFPHQSRREFMQPLAAALASPALASLATFFPGSAQAQSFPTKPLRIVVPFAPGGPTDLMARAIGKTMSQGLGQPVIIDNKSGGGGVIALGEVARAPADGYTLVFPSILSVTNPALMPNYPYDMARDFDAITVVGFIPHALVVRPDFPAKKLADLVAMAKDRPGTLAYGSSGNGTSAHLAGVAMEPPPTWRAPCLLKSPA